MELEICCGGDIITEGFKKERHKDLCFKKTEWMASLYYKTYIMFTLHTHVFFFSVNAFSCGCLYIYICYTNISTMIQLNCIILPFFLGQKWSNDTILSSLTYNLQCTRADLETESFRFETQGLSVSSLESDSDTRTQVQGIYLAGR